MSQLTSRVSDLQRRVGGAGGRRLSGELGCGWSNRAWICLYQGGVVGIVNSVGTSPPGTGAHGGPGESKPVCWQMSPGTPCAGAIVTGCGVTFKSNSISQHCCLLPAPLTWPLDLSHPLLKAARAQNQIHHSKALISLEALVHYPSVVLMAPGKRRTPSPVIQLSL